MLTRRRLFQAGLLAGISATLPSCASLYRSLAKDKLADSKNISLQSGQLRAGFARINITPDPQKNFIPLAGYGEWKMLFKSRRATEIRDNIYTRAVVLDNEHNKIALVNADILIISAELKNAVRKKIQKTGINDFLLAGTHTHSSLGGYINNELAEVLAMGHYQKNIFSFLADKISEAIITADSHCVPAKIGSGTINLPGFNQNRRIKDGPVDPEMGLIKIENTDSIPLGYLVNFAAHPTTLGRVHYISGDYPGFTESSLEGKDEVALFFNGACGDLRSAYPKTTSDSYEKIRRIGKDMAEAGLILSKKMVMEERVKLNCLSSGILLPYIDLYGSNACLHPLSEFFLPYRTDLQVISINNILISALPCDLGVESGIKIKEAAKGKTAIIASYANDYMGYVLPEERYRQGGYEAGMSFYGPKVENLFVEEVIRMMNLIHPPSKLS